MVSISRYSMIKRLWPLLIVLVVFALFFYFDLQKYLSFYALKQHHHVLQQWTINHYLMVVFSFCLIYILAIAVSIPGAIFLTLAAGLLFGLVAGTIYVVFSATLGATILFLAVKYVLGERMNSIPTNRIEEMRKGFNQNAWNYSLVLRLIPLFPFWLVNIVSAMLNVATKTFVITTFFGIIPGTVIYVSLGNSLNKVFVDNKEPNLDIIFTPSVFLPFLGLTTLIVLPVLYKKLRKN